MIIAIDPVFCIGCGLCESLCSESAVFERRNLYFIDQTKCNTCSDCVKQCPADAIKVNIHITPILRPRKKL